jgi:signal peptidase II
MIDGGPRADEGAAVPVRPMGRALAVLVGTAAVVLLTDVVTKYLAVAHLTNRPPVRLLGGAVYLALTRNSGAAFSLGTRYTFVFPLVTLVVVGWIAWMGRRLRSVPWAVSLGLVLGGALGNLGDRLFRAPGFLVGHVVDFISVFSDDGHAFPIFNAADSALCCGVALAILLELTGRRRDGTRLGRESASLPESTGAAERADG